MSAPKHTPGPWFVDEEDGAIWGASGLTLVAQTVNYFPSDLQDREVARVDARVLAAAPQLLELLKRRNERGHSNACALVLRHHGRGRPVPPCDCGHAEAETVLAELEGRS